MGWQPIISTYIERKGHVVIKKYTGYFTSCSLSLSSIGAHCWSSLLSSALLLAICSWPLIYMMTDLGPRERQGTTSTKYVTNCLIFKFFWLKPCSKQGVCVYSVIPNNLRYNWILNFDNFKINRIMSYPLCTCHMVAVIILSDISVYPSATYHICMSKTRCHRGHRHLLCSLASFQTPTHWL